jgi:hypothetical protein
MENNGDKYDDTIEALLAYPLDSVERKAANEISTLRAMLYFAYGYISVTVPEWKDKHPEDISHHFREMFALAYKQWEEKE